MDIRDFYSNQLLEGCEKDRYFAKIIKDSKHIVFFGGAGVSTESGIPDFRSKDGLYNQHDVQFDMYEPEYLLSHSCLYHNPKVFFEYYRQKLDVRGVQPNKAHKVLAEWEKRGMDVKIVTQNIDGLHQKAGSTQVAEIHGTTSRWYCTKCGKAKDPNYVFKVNDTIPRCECGGMIRPDVTLYEEQLPTVEVHKAVKWLSEADCLIIAGTSLQVYPAASYVSYFKGDYMILINREDLDISSFCNLTYKDRVGEVLDRVNMNIQYC